MLRRASKGSKRGVRRRLQQRRGRQRGRNQSSANWVSRSCRRKQAWLAAKEQEAAEILGIPDHLTQAGLIPVAYTKGTDFKPAKRDDVAEITYLDTYKNPIRPA